MSSSSFRLIERTGPNPGMVFDLTKDVIVLGRDVATDIVLGDSEVSREHARLTRTPGGYVLEDLGSTNGTFVNGQRLMAPRVLNPGDLVGMGETVSLTFDAVAPEAAATVARPVAQAPQPIPTPVQPAPAPHVYPGAPPAAPAVAPARKSRLPLILAGGGCLLMLLVCAGVLYLMPTSWWCTLLTPLRILGFSFPGC